MKFNRLLLLYFTVFTFGLSAQTTFRYSYDLGAFDITGGMLETSAGEFVVAGINNSFGPYYGDVMKIDAQGTVMWAKAYTGGLATTFNDIKPVSTGGYIVTGASTNSGGGAILVRLDDNGNIIWAKKYQLPDIPSANASSEAGNAVIETSDGGFLVGGGVDFFWDGVSASTVDTTSALGFKVNSSGVLQWSRVWTISTTNPDEHYINDVAESADGYFFVGNSSEGSGTLSSNGDYPSNALVIKTSTAGALTYIRRWGAGNTTSQQINCARKLTLGANAGKILLGGNDNSDAFIITIDGTGSTPTLGAFNRKLNGAAFPPRTIVVQDVMENTDGNYSIIGWQIEGLTLTFYSALYKINSSTGALIWGKGYSPIGLSSILPEGGICTDQGYYLSVTDQQFSGFNFNIIRTNTVGELGSGAGCTFTALSPTTGTYSVTLSTPTSSNFNLMTEANFTPTVTTMTPTSVQHCLSISCTTPSAPLVGTITQPSCTVSTGSVALSGLPSSGSWTVTASPGGATITGTGSSATFSGLTAGATYTFTVTVSSCTSAASSNAVINGAPVVPSAPVIGTVTQPTCVTSTGSVALSGLPSSGTWTVTASPGGATITGTGTTGTFTGLAPGTYTFSVASSGGTSTLFNETFETGGPGWTFNVVTGTEGADPNFFTVSDAEGGVAPPGCGVPTNGNKTLHVTSVFNPTGGAAYDAGGLCGFLFCPETNRRSESPAISSVGYSGLTLNFKYIANGQAGQDFATVWYNDGTGWFQLGTALSSPLCGSGQGQWSNYSAALPASCNNITNLKIAIKWQNDDDGAGTDPSVAINDITVTAPTSGCSSLASLPITINAVPTIPTAPVPGTVTQPTCATPTGSVTFSGLPASGTWTVTASPGGTTSTGSGTTGTFSGLAAGTYSFTVTNAGGCTSSATASVTINAAPGAPSTPVLGTVTQPTCATPTGSVALSGLPASGTWTINGNPSGTATGTGTTGSVPGLNPGSYTFTVTNSGGCTSTATASVTINAAPTTPTSPILGAVTQPTCSTPTGSVALSGLPASGTWTINGNPSGTATGTGTNGSVTGLNPGSYTFTVTNAGGCTSTATASVTVNAAPGAPSTPVLGTVTQPTCSTPTGSVALSGLPASGTWAVNGNPSGTASGTGTTGTVTGLNPGSYTFTVTNAGGCASTATASVTINAVPSPPADPTAAVTTQPTCAVPTGTLTISAPTGSNLEYSVDGTNWQASPVFTGLTPGTYTVEVTDNSTGCSNTGTVTAIIDPVAGAPTVTVLTEVDVTCFGDNDGSASVQANGGVAPYTYSWSPSGGSSDVALGLSAGNYTVTVTDDAGCSSTADITIGSPATVAVNGVLTNVLCDSSTGGSILTNATGGSGNYTYNWTPNGETTASLTDLAAGTYGVTATDDNGCSATGSFTVVATGSLGVTVTPDFTEIQGGETAVLTATGGTDYFWTPSTTLDCADCATVNASPLTTTLYTVTASDEYGCTGSDTVTVKVNINCGEFFVPNVFSPNGEGPADNNKLCLYGTPACMKELDFAIYNRWGEMVFQTTDITNCWDGLYKDKELNSGIFVYKLYVETIDGEIVEQSGNITLVR